MWTEYIHHYEDQLDFIRNKRLLEIRELIKGFPEFSYITQRIEICLESIDRAILMLSQIKDERHIDKGLNVHLHMSFGDLTDRILTRYNDIVIILSQATSALRLSTKLDEQLSKLDVLDRVLRVPPAATKVFNKFLDESLEVIYGQDFDWNLNLPKPIPVSLYSDYRYLGPSKAICAPPNDVTYLCRWSTVAHELMHSKIDDILSTFNTLGYGLSTKNSMLVKNCQNTLDRLMHAPTETFYHFVDVRDLFIELVKLKGGEVYREAYSLLFQDDYYQPRLFLYYQFQEVLCDIACTRIAGPAEVIVRSYTNADYCRNPELDIYDHLQDLAHPPHSVRAMYERDIIKGTDMNLKGEIIDRIDKQLRELVGADISNKELSRAEGMARYLIKVYFDAVKELMPDLSKLVDELLANKPLFDQKRWDGIISSYKRLSEASIQKDETLRPFDLTNIAWLKVIDVFDETIGKGGTYNDFVKERKRQSGFFNGLWKIASSAKQLEHFGSAHEG